MAKKASSKRRLPGKARSTEVVYHSTKEIKVERELIENFIGLQKVMLTLSAKFEALSSQISRLLDLFEISAKTLAKKEFSYSGDLDAKRIMEKLDNISQQAGLIGRGLALIHETRTERTSGERPMQLHLPSQAIPPSAPKKIPELGSFEKSVISKKNNFEEKANA